MLDQPPTEESPFTDPDIAVSLPEDLSTREEDSAGGTERTIKVGTQITRAALSELADTPTTEATEPTDEDADAKARDRDELTKEIAEAIEPYIVSKQYVRVSDIVKLLFNESRVSPQLHRLVHAGLAHLVKLNKIVHAGDGYFATKEYFEQAPAANRDLILHHIRSQNTPIRLSDILFMLNGSYSRVRNTKATADTLIILRKLRNEGFVIKTDQDTESGKVSVYSPGRIDDTIHQSSAPPDVLDTFAPPTYQPRTVPQVRVSSVNKKTARRGGSSKRN